MICTPCARAADQRLGRDQHCDDEKCMCGHRVEKYGKTTAAPVGLYEQVIAMFGVPLPPYAPPPKGSCPCGGGDFDGESIHAPDCPVHPMRLRAVEAHLDALLPDEVRAAGIHFEFDTTVVVPTEMRTVPADYLADPIIDLGPLIAGYEEALTDTTTEQCRTEYRAPNQPSYRCERTAGHPEDHAAEHASGPGMTFNWTEDVAMYPTTTED